jgi:signal transduction histidine kinase
MSDKKLQLAFLILILLTVAIGLIGILQIQGLSHRIEDLGKRNLRLEKAVLEMRINNTIYSMGIRNYVFWRVSKFLGALPSAINLKNIQEANSRFDLQLKIYQNFAYLAKQKEWAKQVSNSFAELSSLGRKIIDLVNSDSSAATEATISNLLMNFENRLYKIDEFLDNTMGKANLAEVEQQIQRTNSDKRNAIIFLSLILASAATTGILISQSVYKRLRKERLNRTELFNQMINIEEAERKNLSTAVHDQMGQDLSALKIYLGLLEQGLQNLSQDLKEKLAQIKKIVSGLIDKSHNIAFMLRPPDLDEVGLAESLEALVMDYKHMTKTNFVFEKPKEELKLPSEYSLVLYRIAQELLTNMLKHANANNVELRLGKKNSAIDFFYQDDGSGFDYEALTKLPHRRKEDKLRLGLVSLKERVELLDGSMLIDSAVGKGTRISVELPIN